MNGVDPLPSAELVHRRAESAAGRVNEPHGAAKALQRRPRAVGGQLQDPRSPGELPAPVGELRREHLPAAASRRCQEAKSAYWSGSSGRARGTPAKRPA